MNTETSLYSFASTRKPDPVPTYCTLTKDFSLTSSIWAYFTLNLQHPDWIDHYSKQEASDIKKALTEAGFADVYKMPTE